jgi:BASS family bile acid:Na+ symporter
VITAIASNWDLFAENLQTLRPALISLNVATMIIGIGIATAAGFTWQECKTISI